MCSYQLRNLQSPGVCTVHIGAKNNEYLVQFEQPQRAVAPQQVIAFYEGDTCLGAATILRSGPSYWNLGKALPADLDSLHI